MSKSSVKSNLSFLFINLNVTLQKEQRIRSPVCSLPSIGMSASQMGHSKSLVINAPFNLIHTCRVPRNRNKVFLLFFLGYKLRRMRRRSSIAFIVSSDTRPILLRRRSLVIDLISSDFMKLRFVIPPSEILILT